jgi:hypothetical protein
MVACSALMDGQSYWWSMYNLSTVKKWPNQASVPTTTAVTPAADAPVAPAAAAAHL